MGNIIGYDSPVTYACRIGGLNPHEQQLYANDKGNLCRNYHMTPSQDQQPNTQDYQVMGMDYGVDHPTSIHVVQINEDGFVYCPVELDHDWKP